MELKTIEQYIAESANATVGNTPGMGETTLPTVDGKEGSGDNAEEEEKKKKKKEEDDKTNEGKDKKTDDDEKNDDKKEDPDGENSTTPDKNADGTKKDDDTEEEDEDMNEGTGPAYQKYFNKILKKYNVKSPTELDGAKKKEFYDEVDKGWTSKTNESVSFETLFTYWSKIDETK